jgi:hypothetical protein
MSVYNPTGSGDVHVDRVMSGGRKPVAKGMGFKAAAGSVAKKQSIPKKQAQKIIAAGARKASPAAKKANPNLKKVPGKAMTEVGIVSKGGTTSGDKVTKPAMCAEPMPVKKAAKKAVPVSARQRKTVQSSRMKSQARQY